MDSIKLQSELSKIQGRLLNELIAKSPINPPSRIDGMIKIDFVDFCVTERIKSPVIRLFWYFITFGKWGERYHYKHVSMRKYFPVLDNRTSYAHQMLYGKPVLRDYDFVKSAMVDCKCTIGKGDL